MGRIFRRVRPVRLQMALDFAIAAARNVDSDFVLFI